MENYLSWGLGRTTDSAARGETDASLRLRRLLLLERGHYSHCLTLLPTSPSSSYPASFKEIPSLPIFPSTRSLRSMPAALQQIIPDQQQPQPMLSLLGHLCTWQRFRAWLCPCARIKLASWYSVVDDGTTALATATTTPKRSPS